MTRRPTDNWDSVYAVVRQRAGVDLSQYRTERVSEHAVQRMAGIGVSSPEAYAAHLLTSTEECQHLIDAVAVNASRFFRTPSLWDALQRRVIPGLLHQRSNAPHATIHAWSAGCAAGQEAYTLAILLEELRRASDSDWTPLVFATDVDAATLGRARRGLYTNIDLELLPLGWVQRYFDRTESVYRISDDIRRIVHFERHDLTSPTLPAPTGSVFGTVDLLLCRHVLLYLEPDSAADLAERLARVIAPGGFLVLGESEPPEAPLDWGLEPYDEPNSIYQRAATPVVRRAP